MSAIAVMVVSVVLLTTFMPAPVFARARKVRVALMDLQSDRIMRATGSDVSEMLRTALAKSGAYKVLDRQSMRASLDEQDLKQTGVTQPAKAMKTGKKLKCRKLFVGQFTRLDKAFIMTVQCVDVETGKVDFADSTRVESEAGLPEAAKYLAKKLEGSWYRYLWWIAPRYVANAAGGYVVTEPYRNTEKVAARVRMKAKNADEYEEAAGLYKRAADLAPDNKSKNEASSMNEKMGEWTAGLKGNKWKAEVGAGAPSATLMAAETGAIEQKENVKEPEVVNADVSATRPEQPVMIEPEPVVTPPPEQQPEVLPPPTPTSATSALASEMMAGGEEVIDEGGVDPRIAGGRIGVGLNYLGPSFRCFIADRLSVEAKFQYRKTAMIAGPRLYCYFWQLGSIFPYFGIEGDCGSYKHKEWGKRLTGYAAGGFIGAEVFLCRRLSVQVDCGPVYESFVHLNQTTHSSNDGGVEFAVNAGLTFYFDPRKK